MPAANLPTVFQAIDVAQLLNGRYASRRFGADALLLLAELVGHCIQRLCQFAEFVVSFEYDRFREVAGTDAFLSFRLAVEVAIRRGECPSRKQHKPHKQETSDDRARSVERAACV